MLLFCASPTSNATDNQQDNPSTSAISDISAGSDSESTATGGSVGDISITIPFVQKPDISDSSIHTSIQNEISSPDNITIHNTPDVRAPYMNTTSPCRVGVSGGIGVAGFGGSAGTTVEDKECTLRQTAQTFSAMGVPGMGLWLLCRSKALKRAEIEPEACESMVAQMQIEAELGGEVEPPKYIAQTADPRIKEQREEIKELREELKDLQLKESERDSRQYLQEAERDRIQDKLREIPEIKRGT